MKISSNLLYIHKVHSEFTIQLYENSKRLRRFFIRYTERKGLRGALIIEYAAVNVCPNINKPHHEMCEFSGD
jgi:hypothetical protein